MSQYDEQMAPAPGMPPKSPTPDGDDDVMHTATRIRRRRIVVAGAVAAVLVAIAVPVVTRSLFRGKRVRVEVRRARGRAVAVSPRDGELPFLDDGVAGGMSRKRSWWIEPIRSVGPGIGLTRDAARSLFSKPHNEPPPVRCLFPESKPVAALPRSPRPGITSRSRRPPP